MYEKLVARMERGGWQVEYKQVALGTGGSVYNHLADTLKWLGVKNFNTRKKMAAPYLAPPLTPCTASVSTRAPLRPSSVEHT
jgi:hypothetical protein